MRHFVIAVTILLSFAAASSAQVTELAQPGKATLEELCRAIAGEVGGEWYPDLHNAFRIDALVVRGSIRDADGKTLATYTVLPIGVDDVQGQATVLSLYGPANHTLLLGAGPKFTVIETLSGKEKEAVKKARAGLTKVLELSPPKITLDMYRPVLAAAQKALSKAQAKALPDLAPGKRSPIAVGQEVSVENRDGTLVFVWMMPTSSKTGYRVTAERSTEGKVTVPAVTLGL